MANYIKEYIEENIALIEANDFNHLYSNCHELWVGELTSILYQAGIDPLLHMDAVPKEFAYNNSKLTDIVIPSNIKIIYPKAFQRSGVYHVAIDEGCAYIHTSAFASCVNLEVVELPSSIGTIDTAAFFGCSNLHTIVYAGTYQEWCENVYKGPNWLGPVKMLEVVLQCTDKEYRANGDDID